MGTLLDDTSILDEATSLAADMLDLARDTLLAHVRFTNRPLAALPPRVAMDRAGCSTDGCSALFSPAFVLDAHRAGQTVLPRAYMHMILHCLLGHVAPPPDADRLRWSCAADLAVECVLADLGCEALEWPERKREANVAHWASQVKEGELPTAPTFYRLLAAEGLGESQLADLQIAIGTDAHDPWFPKGIDEQDEDDGDTDRDRQRLEQLQRRWQQVARQTSMDMDRAEGAADTSSLKQQLGNREAATISLDELLTLFATPHEDLRVSDSEFDYIYYTYGLSATGDIALVEPLEYSDDVQLRDFCIAIDTSGSVAGPLVEGFIRLAAGVLMDGSIGDATRVHVLQCDDRIRSHETLQSAQDVARYLETMQVEGLGATDFNPVFDWMDKALETGEVLKWDALLYFTDGLGEFPQTAPSYDVAFVFAGPPAPVPTWATTAVVDPERLKDEQGNSAATSAE